VTLNRAPKSARLWTVDSLDRDFRNDRWVSRDLPVASGSMEVAVKVERPAQGYRAFLVEAVLASTTGHEYKLSTEARVTPDTAP
jgi:PhoPQ-activated pathogenicity-related protein